MDYGGHRVPLELPIDLNEVHHSDHMVIVDEPLPVLDETKLPCNKAS